MMKLTNLKVVNSIAFAFAIVMNTLANALPLGGKDTGELSAMYPNLFVPAGMTFAIWGVIYVAIVAFLVYLWLGRSDDVIKSLGPWFTINCIANGTWIAVWHAQLVEVSFLVMLVILFSLIKIYRLLDIKYDLSYLIWKVPFSLYIGWISVATIANATTVLVDNGITDLGLGADAWAALMCAVAGLLALLFLWARRDIFYATVIVWALYGINSKRISDAVSVDPLTTQLSMIVMAAVAFFLVVQLVLLIRSKLT